MIQATDQDADGYSLGELCERAGAVLRGDPRKRIRGVAGLGRAQAHQISFLANRRLRRQLAGCAAGAVVLAAADAEGYGGDCLIAEQPYAAFARIAALFERRPARPPGIHPSAVIDPAAVVEADVHVGPLVSIGPGCRIRAGAVLGAGCTIGEDCEVGEGCELVARVSLVRRVRLGRRVLIHPGAVLGADGFGLAMDAGRWLKVPQLGGVVVGDDCEIGANTTIDRGALDDTVLEEDVRLDNQVQIGHNVRIGAHSALAGCTGVAGSTRIGRYCLIAGAVGIVGHIEICDHVTVAGMSRIGHSIAEPGEYGSGVDAQPQRLWQRNLSRLHRLDELARKVRAMEKEKTPHD